MRSQLLNCCLITNTLSRTCGSAQQRTETELPGCTVSARECVADDFQEVTNNQTNNTRNNQTSSDEELAEEPSITTTRKAVAALDVLQILSLPDFVFQHTVILKSIKSAVIVHSVCHTTLQKKISDFFRLLEFTSDVNKHSFSKYAYLLYRGQ